MQYIRDSNGFLSWLDGILITVVKGWIKLMSSPPLPQELDILGSTHTFACFFINYNSGPYIEQILGGWGLIGWLKNLIKIRIYILVVVLLMFMMICLPCILQCVQKLIGL